MIQNECGEVTGATEDAAEELEFEDDESDNDEVEPHDYESGDDDGASTIDNDSDSGH